MDNHQKMGLLYAAPRHSRLFEHVGIGFNIESTVRGSNQPMKKLAKIGDVALAEADAVTSGC